MSAWFLPIAATVLGGIQAVNAGKQAEQLGYEQELLAEKNALLARRELQEQVRRQQKEDERLRSAALARAAASGAQISDSVADYLDYFEEEQERQINWLKTSGASRIRLQLSADRIQAKTTRQRGRNQQMSAFFGTITKAYAFGKAGGMFSPAGAEE